jgi:acetylornithine/succinyldiaminopimelate/putrescine aminotransferase
MVKTKNREITNSFKFDIDSYKKEKHKYEPSNISEMPIKWDKAENFNVFDDKGNKWIDTTSGIFVANSGHSNPKIKEAIKNQLDDNLMFAYQYNTNIRYEFVKKLLDISPNHFDKVVLLNSGSEATDAAYRLIKGWAKKNNKKYIITFTGSYHGRVLGSDLMGGDKDSTKWSNVVDDDIVFLEFPYEEQELNIDKLPPLNEIATFFLETYQGWGAWFYPQKYIDKLYKISRENNILFCFDEVQSGFYRMGTLYGYQTYGDYKPDLITVGKGLTSSLPLSAVISRKEIIDADSSTNLSSTHAGNTLCCAAGLANLNFLTDDNFQTELKIKSEFVYNKCNELMKYDIIETINVRGLIVGIILNDVDSTNRIVENCIKDGILMMCTKRESIKLGPPLTITIEALEEVFEVLENNIKREID